MGYRRALLVRWSRRDRLAVLVVALAVAFLVGTALVVLAAGAQTAALAEGYGSDGHVSLHPTVAEARTVAGSTGLVLPYAEATGPGDETVIVVARPEASTLSRELGLDGAGATVGSVSSPQTIVLAGDAGQVTVDVARRQGESVLPPDWFLVPPESVDSLGVEGALAIRPETGSSTDGAPLRAALAFFRLGTREALGALGLGGLGAGVLVGVTVFGVTRMGVRDRLGTIRVVRATGALPRTVVGLFALRAALLAAVGAALGYALGVILPNAAVSVAIALGATVSLPLAVTEEAVVVLVPAVLGPVVLGTVAGALAAYPAATRPPGRIEDAHTPGSRASGFELPSWLTPGLLDGRLVVPTAATLAAFVVLATIAAGLGAAMAPVAAPDGSTVVEPDAPHPLASQVPAAYADALDDQGIVASGEILLLEAVDGRPFLAVGAEFDRYAAVHEATLVEGEGPSRPREAVVGASLARALDVEVGERLVLGGSTERKLTVVTVVGRFEAPGPAAGQLVVPLATARVLSGVPPGAVHVVSAERLPASGSAATVGVVDVTVPDRVPAGAPLTVRVTVRNDGLEAAEPSLAVRYRGQPTRRTVEVGPVAERTVAVEVPAGPPGERTLRVGAVERTVRVVEPGALTIEGVPAVSPPDGRPLVRVLTLDGEPVANATVTVGERSWRTDDAGQTRLAFSDTGEATVVASAGEQTAQVTVEVRSDAERPLEASLAVRPSNPSVLVRPTAVVQAANPWAVAIERELTLRGPGMDHRTVVTVEPGQTTTVEVPLDRQPAGRYDLELRLDGDVAATASYAVSGDDRLAAALASSGRTGATGLSRAVEAALGNLQLVVAVVVGLAALMTVGAIAATFAAGVQARRRTLGVHRATGAEPARVLRLVLADALRLGLAATAVGLAVGLAVVALAAEWGLLTVLGLRVAPVPSRPVLAGIVAASLGLTLLGAGLAAWGVLRTSPGALLAGAGDRTWEAGDD